MHRRRTLRFHRFAPKCALALLTVLGAGTAHALTHEQVLASNARVEAKLAPIAASAWGAHFEIKDLWNDRRSSPFADRKGSSWLVLAYGGFAERAGLSTDGYELLLCHEYGHQMGGFPFGSQWGWPSSEGQSDYVAAFYCARKIWGGEPAENAEAWIRAREGIHAQCSSVWTAEANRNLCARILEAGENLARVFDPRKSPAIETPDTTVLEQTWHGHSDSQCRLDTFVAGALCTGSWNDRVIPGLNHPDNQHSLGAEREALPYGCPNRPRCWFKPRVP